MTMSINAHELKNLFAITPQVLDERQDISGYIQSFSTLITDRLYDKLTSDERFNVYLHNTDLLRLKQTLNLFLVSLYKDPFDDRLVDTIKRVGRIHHSFQIPPLLLSSAFDLLHQCIFDLALVNTFIQKHLKVIFTFLKIAETVMLQADHNEQLERLNHVNQDYRFLTMFDVIFRAFSIHRTKYHHLQTLWEEKQSLVQPLDDHLPTSRACDCSFTHVIQDLCADYEALASVGIDADVLSTCHEHYHSSVAKFYELYALSPYSLETAQAFDHVSYQSAELFKILNQPLTDVSNLSFLAVSSGIRFVHKCTLSFQNHEVVRQDDDQKLFVFLRRIITEIFDETMEWCIDELRLTTDLVAEKYDCQTVLTFFHTPIHIAIRLKDLVNKLFLLELMEVFFEILKMNLISKERETSLVTLAGKAEAANRSKDLFLTNMSHELRTPLNAIIGFAQILQLRPEIPQTMKPYVEKISVAGKNLLTLVNTIPDFAKLEAGRFSFHPKVVFLSRLLEEVMTIITPLATAKSIELIWPKEISLVLYIDPQLIKQVLINLLSNAIKFTPDNGVVTVSALFDEIHRCYTLSVRDTGVGMTPEETSKLFTPFTQIDNPLQKTTQGTGLGLAISKRIIEDLHEGKIWVESSPQEGSCFSFCIPLRTDQNVTECYPSPTPKAHQLLIVEDSLEHKNILVEHLTHFYHITWTNSVNHAKEILSYGQYDYIILDFFLIDGISSEVLQHMERNEITTPVIILSAEDDHRIVTHLQTSSFIVGIFNKSDIHHICTMITNGASV